MRVERVLRAPRDIQELRVPLASQVSRDQQGHKAAEGFRKHREFRDGWDTLDHRDRKDHREFRVSKGHREIRDEWVSRDHKVRRAGRDF